MRDPFVLFCAGEDSGDILGEPLVRECVRLGFKVQGVGGQRMQCAGLVPTADYEMLPVSGFGDVLPHIFRLKKILSLLASLLRDENCMALVCIDYPGFNMKLSRMAFAMNKPVLYVAPPQVWAWKKHRARRLKGTKLAVLFDFERRTYESLGLNADILEHPFLRAMGSDSLDPNALGLQKHDATSQGSGIALRQDVLLLPGSRKKQALRNLRFFMAVASRVHALYPERRFVIAASRDKLKTAFEQALASAGGIPDGFCVEVVPQEARERAAFYARHAAALCMPGSATLELALSGVSLVAADVLDPLTYFMGKHFVKTDYFALPNVLLKRGEFPEFFFTRRASLKKKNVKEVAEALRKAFENPPRSTAGDLVNTFGNSKSAESLMSEFLREFVERDTH